MCNIYQSQLDLSECNNKYCFPLCDAYGCNEIATSEIIILDDEGEDKGIELVCDNHNPNKNINEF